MNNEVKPKNDSLQSSTAHAKIKAVSDITEKSHKHKWYQNGTCEGEDNRPVYSCECGAYKDCDNVVTE